MPTTEGDAEGLGPAAVLVILLLGVAVSVLVATFLKRSWQLGVEREAQVYASTLANVVGEEVQRTDDLLRRRATLWARDSFSGDPDAWREDVTALLADEPAMLAVLRADPSWSIAGSEEGKAILRDVLPEARRRETAADSEWIVPLQTTDGQVALGFQVSASRDGTDAHTVFAVVAAESLLRGLLDSRAVGYGLVVRDGNTILYRRDPDGDGMLSLTKEEPIRLPGEHRWTLAVTPGPAAFALGSIERATQVVIAGGILASILIAAAVHFGTLSWRRERMLRGSNRTLQHQIDDTRRGEEELRQLSTELEQRVAMRTAELNETIVELETFNYSVSHDLRGPLGAVINFAAILQEDYGDRLDATGRDHLGRIVGSATSAVSMMDALLAYSRSGRTELRKRWLDMQKLARDAHAEVVAASPRGDCALESADLPPAYADENMMRLVFTNLFGNACKFAREGEAARIHVTGHVEGEEIVYVVRDEGIGFDMRFADKLFKVFERLHPADRHVGHGVGLAIVARVVRRHGGRVWAQGAPGKGATFYFTIPRTEA